MVMMKMMRMLMPLKPLFFDRRAGRSKNKSDQTNDQMWWVMNMIITGSGLSFWHDKALPAFCSRPRPGGTRRRR